MLLVLCHGSDASAHQVCERLRARSSEPVELVLIESLGYAGTTWRHELGEHDARIEIGLAGGGRLRTGDATAVLNRMLQPPLGLATGAVHGDADYARNELTSFAASWVRTLAPRVVNQPTPQGLCGRWRPALQWRVLALEVGLPIVPLTLDSEHPPDDPYGHDGTPSTIVLTIDGEPFADGMPDAVREAVGRFAGEAQTPILGLRFAGEDPAREGWRLLDATPYPDLAGAGEAALDALERLLAA